MLKRTLFFSNPYHLSVKNDQLMVASKDSGEIKQIPVEDTGFVVFDHPHITFTQSVMQKMAENNTAVVFCDQKHHPSSLLFHLDTNTVQSELFRKQIDASEPLKKNLWKQTVQAKIKNQAALLKKSGNENKLMENLVNRVMSGDTSNVEAQASKIYWKFIFGLNNFKRERYGMPPNPSLNYGYAILRAAVARALAGSGLLPTLGIHHHNKYNAYCLADDMMEPYRPFVDEIVLRQLKQSADYHNLTTERKTEFLNLLSMDTSFENIRRPLMIGLSVTTASLVKCFAGTQKKLEFPLLK